MHAIRPPWDRLSIVQLEGTKKVRLADCVQIQLGKGSAQFTVACCAVWLRTQSAFETLTGRLEFA